VLCVWLTVDPIQRPSAREVSIGGAAGRPCGGLGASRGIRSASPGYRGSQQPATIAYGLLPRDVFISVEQRTPGNLDPADWEILRGVVDPIKVNAPGGELGPTLELIESALRSDSAQLIDAD
jgi:hypothetical protein